MIACVSNKQACKITSIITHAGRRQTWTDMHTPNTATCTARHAYTQHGHTCIHPTRPDTHTPTLTVLPVKDAVCSVVNADPGMVKGLPQSTRFSCDVFCQQTCICICVCVCVCVYKYRERERERETEREREGERNRERQRQRDRDRDKERKIAHSNHLEHSNTCIRQECIDVLMCMYVCMYTYEWVGGKSNHQISQPSQQFAVCVCMHTCCAFIIHTHVHYLRSK
jgi:hypothetical protein